MSMPFFEILIFPEMASIRVGEWLTVFIV